MSDKDFKEEKISEEEEIKAAEDTEIMEEITTGEADAGEIDELTRLRNELEAKEAEAKKNHEMYLRALAELENFRKRAAREREEYIKYASLPLIKKFLSVVDDLERALESSEDNEDYQSLKKGLEMILKKMHEIMQTEGVEPIEALGKPFNPEYHQPLSVEESSEHPADTVIAELQKGYLMHGRVIRPSLVKVSS
ncbi:nucleotide exchange factor GrpE [Thermosyntropha sp.]|uniref:nucleotide exchange factor GrpE n=1 Tax=Thermosyntropha sp. TaxID=2740820 RepID=UPI0025F97324|nr:nucleotide exchange factor GrpE [Thermosyntropha sp.]MBO8159155.1 nucleotide exchange factor GrpE [Thermosyntropha sp.]